MTWNAEHWELNDLTMELADIQGELEELRSRERSVKKRIAELVSKEEEKAND